MLYGETSASRSRTRRNGFRLGIEVLPDLAIVRCVQRLQRGGDLGIGR